MNAAPVLDYLDELLGDLAAPAPVRQPPSGAADTAPAVAASTPAVDAPGETAPAAGHDLDSDAGDRVQAGAPAAGAGTGADPAAAEARDDARIDADAAGPAAEPAIAAGAGALPAPTRPVPPPAPPAIPVAAPAPVAAHVVPTAPPLPAAYLPMQQYAPPPPPQAPADVSVRWLRLRCGTQIYALELLKVQEVVLPAPLLPLRGTSAAMLGVMNLRGQVVPLLDLGRYLGSAPVAVDAATRIVVLEEQGDTLGLLVSAVDDVTTLHERQIEPPDNARPGRFGGELFRGIARQGQQPLILLDAAVLLRAS